MNEAAGLICLLMMGFGILLVVLLSFLDGNKNWILEVIREFRSKK